MWYSDNSKSPAPDTIQGHNHQRGKNRTCPKGNQSGILANKKAFGAALSTGNVKNKKYTIRPQIEAVLLKSGISFIQELQNIQTNLSDVYNAMESQAKGKGACGAAGQMQQHMQDLSIETNRALQVPEHPRDKIENLLGQIMDLLDQLDGTVHTNPDLYRSFQGR